MAQTLSEMETHLNMTADNRSVWEVFSDDPVLQRRLESVGATLVREESSGGKHYTLPDSQITFRKPRKPMDAARKAQLAAQLAESRKKSVITDAE